MENGPFVFLTTSTPNTARLSFVKGASSCSCLFLPTVKRKNAIDPFSPDGKVRTVNHLSDCISYTYSVRHLGWVLHFIRGRSPGSKNKAQPAQVTMQIRILWQPVTEAGDRILCQVLLFDSRLLVAAVASPRFSGPQMWMACGICLSCGLRCHSDKALLEATPLLDSQTVTHHANSFSSLFFQNWLCNFLVFFF